MGWGVSRCQSFGAVLLPVLALLTSLPCSCITPLVSIGLQLDVAETVYNDSLACAWRRELAALPAPMARRGGLTNRAQLPDSEALASLVQVGGEGGGEGVAEVLRRTAFQHLRSRTGTSALSNQPKLPCPS